MHVYSWFGVMTAVAMQMMRIIHFSVDIHRVPFFIYMHTRGSYLTLTSALIGKGFGQKQAQPISNTKTIKFKIFLIGIKHVMFYFLKGKGGIWFMDMNLTFTFKGCIMDLDKAK
ncbi:hypothetical protein ACJX0J_018959 [Zea mays]